MRASVSRQPSHFSRASAMRNGCCGERPATGSIRVSQISEHMPMFTYTRSDAPATPTESAPSLRMWGTARSVPSGIFSMAVGR